MPAGNLLAAGVLAAARRHAVGRRVHQLGLAHPVPAQRAARRRRAVHPPADRGVAAVPGGRGDGDEGAEPGARRRARLPAAAGDRLRRAARDRRRVLRLRALHHHLRDHGARAARRASALDAVLIGSALQLVLIPAFGALSDRVGRRPVYAAGALGALAWAFAFFPLLDTKAWGWIVVAAVGGLVCPRAHVRAAGGVHHRAVRHAGALQRRLARLPARRRGGRGAGADHRDRAARRLRLLARRLAVRRRWRCSSRSSRSRWRASPPARTSSEAAPEEEARLVARAGGTGSRRCAPRERCAAPASASTSAARSPTSSRSSTAGW